MARDLSDPSEFEFIQSVLSFIRSMPVHLLSYRRVETQKPESSKSGPRVAC